MFSRHNERQPGDTSPLAARDDHRPPGISALPSTGIRDAIVMPVAPEPTAHNNSESVIGKQDRFEGTMRVQRGLRVLGQIEGEIEAATSVTVEEGARVEADLTADEAIIAGEYSGKLVCRQRLEIRSTGLVKGEIETVRLMLHEGGFIDGALHMQRPGGSLGSDSARVSDSLRSGLSPRSSSESLGDSGSEHSREPATMGGRTSASGSARPMSR